MRIAPARICRFCPKKSLDTTTLCCYERLRLHYVAVDSNFMRCPKCGNQDDKVIDSRASREGSTIRRRRQCLQCDHRFTTYEEIEHEGLMVVKRDGRREEFSKEKLLAGLKKACQKRPISPKVIEDLVERIMDEISDKYEREVPGMAIGERVMEGLREIDKVAYVRFASVYRRFEEATEFVREVKKLEADHDSTQG
ncbi:MAG: transcriptional regulator NrdR [Verrucomicrobiota bacterium]